MLSKAFRACVGMGLAAAMAGCNTAGDKGGGPDFGLGQSPAAQTQPGQTQPGQLTTNAPAGVTPVVQGSCPQVGLRDGTAVYRTYAKGAKAKDAKDKDSSQVVVQASLADATRSCSRDTNNLYITVMVQGRLVAGPQGKAGDLTLPIRVAVVDGDKVLSTELVKYPVKLADPAQASQFVFTRQSIAVPGTPSSLTRVYVGFDEGPYNTK